ncbi:sialate O-acetylesterase [Mucilaginibacter pedocola]|nr:sialate O-acetylesterase [Mucilaginibacter pedocola]
MRLPNVISANMILQRNAQVPVWGWAAPGQQVRVAFAGQVKTVVAAADSAWHVKLATGNANSKPQVLSITAGKETKQLENILIGDVWLCSGQSNMNYAMDRTINNFAAPAKGADSAALAMKEPHPGIRIMKVEMQYDTPDVPSTGWHEAKGRIFERSSVVAFYFAKQLQAKLHIPIGIITSAWDGSRIEPWTPPIAYKNIPAFEEDIKKNSTAMDKEKEGRMYNSMIKPLGQFGLKGIIWYQGESNCMIEEQDMRYAYKMQAMVASWRKQFGAQLPFYYTLIAPYIYTEWRNGIPHTIETLPKFWEQQVAAAQIPGTAFVTTTDLVDVITDIHPSYKWVVGRRLANLALSKTYRQKGIPYLEPTYAHKKIEGDKLVLYFKNANGLKTRDGKSPDFFEIAGADGKYLSAQATIKGNTLVLQNADIKAPTEARFAWTQFAMPNLVNGDDLPMVPFRTNAVKWEYIP